MKKLRTADFSLSMIKQIELEAAKIPGAVSLAQGIPSFALPQSIKSNLIKSLELPGINKYSLTNGLPQLREAVSLELERDGIYADPDREIIITAGAIEAISATLLTVLSAGDEVILLNPCYASYQSAVGTAHGKIRWVDLKPDWSLDLEAFKQAINKNTRAVLLANPNNPTGTVLSPNELNSIAELARRAGIYLLVDEVYREFVFGKSEYSPILREPKFKDNVISIYSFSKSYAMTGFRVGYLVAHEKLVTEILKVHDALVNSAPTISQYAALYALDLADDVIGFKKEFLARKTITMKWLRAHRRYFDYTEPRAGYFVFPKLKNETDTVLFARDLLKTKKVAVVPGIAFGPAGAGHIRISFGADRDKIETGLTRISEYLNA